MSDELLVEADGAILRLTMNRPEKHNALNHTLTRTLLEALQMAGNNPAVRVVVLHGAGRSFCAGADTAEFSQLGADQPAAVAERAALTTQLHAAFSHMNCPVIASVRGYALGGGCGLALAADLAIAADSAIFGLPEIRHGIVPAVVMANLVAHVGRKAAFELVATGDRIDARRALELGMLTRVVPDDELEGTTTALALQIAATNAQAMASAKRLFYRVADLTLEQGLDAGRDANIIMRSYRESGQQ